MRKFPRDAKSVAERFSQQVVPVTESGCWLWTGYTNVQGYGHFQAEMGRTSAHRYSLEKRLGRALSPGRIACHKCDTPACVNPDHLYEGTYKSNAQDTRDRGRRAKNVSAENYRRGERHHSARLADADVLAIRASRDTLPALAKRYGISRNSVIRVRSGITWKHLPIARRASGTTP